MTEQLPILARQAVSVLGIAILEDIGRRAAEHATGTMSLNFLDGGIPSWTMLERHERKRKEASR